jgi:hypothetical protein
VVTNAGQYFSTYDLCRSHEAEWSHIAQHPWLAGGAMWPGIDYAGETCGWPMVTSQFGVLDRARFPNDVRLLNRVPPQFIELATAQDPAGNIV